MLDRDRSREHLCRQRRTPQLEAFWIGRLSIVDDPNRT